MKKSLDWRIEPATERQKRKIESMRETAGMNGAIIPPPFTGTTKGEACDYIAHYISNIYRSVDCDDNAGDRI